MTLSSARRRTRPGTFLASGLLGASLLAAGGIGAIALAAEEESPAADVEAAPAAATIAPSPTPYPEFDASAFTLRADLFARGFDQPVYITDDGVPQKPQKACLYVVERAGRIKIINAVGVTSTFLDISGRVNSDDPQQGLLGLAFHPDFGKNGRYFVHYTDDKNNSVIAEFKGTPCKKSSAKPVRTLLTIDQSYSNNNGGWIGFGPDDKMLYIPIGDGGGPAPGDPNGVGQLTKGKLAKVLRIDVDDPKSKPYGIPSDNPYLKIKNGKPKARGNFFLPTWAWGLRDPRRASFDSDTGDFWIGDVGQLQSEVNLVPVGSVDKDSGAPNFGWSEMEGFDCYPPDVLDCDPSQYVMPVYAYDQVAPQQAITGGYVYRGDSMDRELRGVYLFSDFRSGDVWGLDAEAVYAGFEPTVHLLLEAPQGVVSFGEDDAGELYLVSLDGSIYRLNTDAR